MVIPAIISPEEILKNLRIRKGMIIADFGCGHGFYSISLAKIAGEDGQVFAIDVLPQALEAVMSKAKIEGLHNIVPLRANLEKENGSKLNSESCDLVMIADILFQSPKKSEIIKEGARILKRGGRVVFIEWNPEAKGIGPEEKYRVSKKDVRKMALEAGLKFEEEFEPDINHYGLIFSK